MPFVGSVAFAGGPGDSVMAVLGPLAGEPRLRLPARGQHLRRPLPGEPLVRPRGRTVGGSGARRAGAGGHLPGDPARRRERPLPADRSAGARRLQGHRHRPRRGLDGGEQRHRACIPHPSWATARPARRSWCTRRRGGGTGPIRSTWCSTPAARSATAATRCSPTSRATAFPARPRCPSRCSTSSRSRSTTTRSGSAGAGKSRAR